MSTIIRPDESDADRAAMLLSADRTMAHGLKSDNEELRRKVLALRALPDDGSQFSPALLHQTSRPLTWAAISRRLGISKQRARVLGRSPKTG